MIAEDVLSFSVEYCNSRKDRTIARKKKIRAAYKEVFGKEMRGTCPTCYIEAMLEIVRSFKSIKKLNITKMAVNYELKRGVLLQEFGHPEKACTNNTLTDELAQWHLSRHPEKAVLFARLPSQIPQPLPTVVQIIPPAQPEKTDIVESVMVMAGVKEEKAPQLKDSPKKPHKTKK